MITFIWILAGLQAITGITGAILLAVSIDKLNIVYVGAFKLMQGFINILGTKSLREKGDLDVDGFEDFVAKNKDKDYKKYTNWGLTCLGVSYIFGLGTLILTQI